MAVVYKSVSLKRLKREYDMLQKSPPTGISLSLPSDSDLYTWEATIDGPEESVYKGGKFKARILTSVEYPMKPPEVHFVRPFPYHLNVSQSTGQVCLGVLGGDKWEPSLSIEHVLQSLTAILIRPETSSAMDHETLNNYCNFRGEYDYMAKESARKAARSFK